MENKILKFLSIIIILLLIMALFQIYNLNQEIQSIKSDTITINSNLYTLGNTVNNIIAKQNSLVLSQSVEYLSADKENMTGTVAFNIVPKELTKNSTASLIIGEAEYPLTTGENGFSGEVTLPIFSDNSPITLKVSDGESSYSENLLVSLNLMENFFLMVDVLPMGGSKASGPSNSNTRKYEIYLDTAYELSIKNPESIEKIKSMNIAAMQNDMEVFTEELSLNSKENYDKFIEDRKSDNAVPEYQRSDTDYFYSLDKKFEIPFETDFRVYVIIEDENGYNYWTLLERIEIDENGNYVDPQTWWRGIYNRITDKDGVILFESKPAE